MKIGISGHQDIPPGALAFVKRGITRVVSGLKDDLVGVSSLAAGADQMFASIILEYGGQLHIIIPSEGYETTFAEREDLDRFRLLLNRADSVETLSYPEPSEDAFFAAGHRVVDKSDLLIAVWDERPVEGKGGTADIVHYARSRGTNVEVIWPPGVTR
ncbi:MAG: hypothetical protein ACREBG_08840 [Pyrinomonadaceae bacterium]